MSFYLWCGVSDPQTVTVSNVGDAPLDWSADSGYPFSFEPSSGTLAAGDSVDVSVVPVYDSPLSMVDEDFFFVAAAPVNAKEVVTATVSTEGVFASIPRGPVDFGEALVYESVYEMFSEPGIRAPHVSTSDTNVFWPEQVDEFGSWSVRFSPPHLGTFSATVTVQSQVDFVCGRDSFQVTGHASKDQDCLGKANGTNCLTYGWCQSQGCWFEINLVGKQLSAVANENFTQVVAAGAFPANAHSDDVVVSIDWGDGSSASNGGLTVDTGTDQAQINGNHTYAAAGTYNGSVKLMYQDPQRPIPATFPFTVQVSAN